METCSILYDRDLRHERVKVSIRPGGSPQPNELTFNITISWHPFADVKHTYTKFSSMFFTRNTKSAQVFVVYLSHMWLALQNLAIVEIKSGTEQKMKLE